jgi:hypothetical protein
MWQAMKERTQVLRSIVTHLTCPVAKQRLGELFGNDQTQVVARQVVE